MKQFAMSSNNDSTMDFPRFEAPDDIDFLPSVYDEGHFPPPASSDSSNTTMAAAKENCNHVFATMEAKVQDDDAASQDANPTMVAVNDDLEHELTEIKTTVKRMLKDLVVFQTVTTEVNQQWSPVQQAEHQETARLNDLQTDVHGSVGTEFPLRL
jgi:hypothetical protein